MPSHIRWIWRNQVLVLFPQIVNLEFVWAQRNLAIKRSRLANESDHVELQRRFEKLKRTLWPRVSTELVRIGSSGDGGYLLPASHGWISEVFSPGVAEVADFENHFAMLGAECFLADGSVDAAPIAGPTVYFDKKFIGPLDNPQWLGFEDWVNGRGKPSASKLLQMDIEGGEYDVFMSTSKEFMSQFKIVVLELHDLHLIWQDPQWKRVEHLLDLLNHDFIVVHSHINNSEWPVRIASIKLPPLVEVTFVRRDSLGVEGDQLERNKRRIWHALDRKNNARLPAFKLEKIWSVPDQQTPLML